MKAKRLIGKIIVAACLMIAQMGLTGCLQTFMSGTQTNVTNAQGGQDINQAKMESYNGPKARIAVARFTSKVHGNWYNRNIGDGMKDQLATALVNTGRFIVLERQNMDALMEEISFGDSGLVKKRTAPKMGEIEGADLLVVAAITEFEENAGGTSARAVVRDSKLANALFGNGKKAHIAIDLRVIDAQTSRILAATSVEGKATDSKLGVVFGGLLGNSSGSVQGALSSWENTPKEKALRVVINKAVEFIVSKTPQSFYRATGGQASLANAERTKIKTMQTILARLGYDVGSPDGIAGEKTIIAVCSYQKENSLEVSGKFDEPTVQSLRAMLRKL